MTNAITGVRTVAVPVADQDRAVEFYVGVLGLAKRLDVPAGRFGGRWIEVAPAGAATSIALVPADERTPAGTDTGIRLTTGDAAALREELAARGVEVGELLRWEGVPPMFVLRDADGNGLVVVE
ncbi:VOC family protein [Nonomuraea roseoviolacea subsp. roseoviolacea]|uniref:Catechol 2,3-dioxygenase-like lactoylglutathione lyase family enzyme n=1 Tax=Nonomuraea roseoviolacea subsp. carminata TaxID=160689 RepID=A0ABT1KDJ7_9ACTN|nr:VOC family protein [Nonomuraea roseoviolacea]MCP2352096.1 catechol 2,3-dioxygenase-like lactoylglutathione lyase family enzyme [Nonomuraea roseoviolacea subsp. carminata]